MTVREIGEAKDIKIEQIIWRFHKEGEPWEKAELIGKLRELGMKEKEIGKKLGLPQYEVSRYLRLLNLTPKLFKALKEGKIARITAYELSKLPQEEQRRFEKMLDGKKKKLTFQRVEEYRKQQAIKDVLDVIEETPDLEDLGRAYANVHIVGSKEFVKKILETIRGILWANFRKKVIIESSESELKVEEREEK